MLLHFCNMLSTQLQHVCYTFATYFSHFAIWIQHVCHMCVHHVATCFWHFCYMILTLFPHAFIFVVICVLQLCHMFLYVCHMLWQLVPHDCIHVQHDFSIFTTWFYTFTTCCQHCCHTLLILSPHAFHTFATCLLHFCHMRLTSLRHAFTHLPHNLNAFNTFVTYCWQSCDMFCYIVATCFWHLLSHAFHTFTICFCHVCHMFLHFCNTRLTRLPHAFTL